MLKDLIKTICFETIRMPFNDLLLRSFKKYIKLIFFKKVSDSNCHFRSEKNNTNHFNSSTDKQNE